MSNNRSAVGIAVSNDAAEKSSDLQNHDSHATLAKLSKPNVKFENEGLPPPQRREKDLVENSVEQGQEETLDLSPGGANLYEAIMALESDSSDFSEEEVSYIATRDVLQVPLQDGEEFKPHPHDATKVIATFRFQKPDNTGWYIQVDEIPELITTAPPTSEKKSYFKPSLNDAKCPRRLRPVKNKPAGLWVREVTNDRWKRKNGKRDETFHATVLFRRFNSTTHKYEYAHFGEKMLNNINPNNKAWMYSYNKWIDQMKRRRDSTYVQEIQRTHWTVPEVLALYTEINKFCREVGVDAFGFGKGSKFKHSDLQVIADAINDVGDNDRKIDAVRGKIISAHSKKNKSLADLQQRATAMRVKITAGDIPPDEERYPTHAIPLSEFPEADATPALASETPQGDAAGSVNSSSRSSSRQQSPEESLPRTRRRAGKPISSENDPVEKHAEGNDEDVDMKEELATT